MQTMYFLLLLPVVLNILCLYTTPLLQLLVLQLLLSAYLLAFVN